MNQTGRHEKSVFVSAIFGNIAKRYDLLNTLMSFGQHQKWRRATICMASKDILVDGPALDIATGTCDFATKIATIHPNTTVIGLDFSLPMIKVGFEKIVRKNLNQRINLALADGHKLPFKKNTFALVTIGFGIRNFANPKIAISEISRVLKPRGRLAVLEIFPIQNPHVGSKVFSLGFRVVAPILGQLFANNRQAYEYLPASAEGFMSSDELLKLTEKCGLFSVSTRNFALGSVSALISEKHNMVNKHKSMI